MALNLSKLKTNNKNICMLHLASEKLNKYHLAYWIEIFDKYPLQISYLVRDKKSFKELIRLYPTHQILFASTPVDVETIVNAQVLLKAVFFSLNTVKDIHLLRFNHLKHIFIGTKESKQLLQYIKAYRAYDEIWVSGQHMIDKYKSSFENVGHMNLKIIGKPQIKEIFLENETYENRHMVFIYLSKSPSILLQLIHLLLYSINRYSICLIVEQYSIINNLKMMIKGYSSKVDSYPKNKISDVLSSSFDYFITDIDTISIAYLAYNKPLLVYVDKNIDKTTLKLDIPNDALYLFSNQEEFLEIVKNIDKDILKSKRDYYTQYFLGKIETLEDRFAQELIGL